MVRKRCAVLLCKFNDDPSEPRPHQFYRDFFTEDGAGKGGAFDYWTTVSYGNLDLRGSRVFGWFTMSHSTDEVGRLVFPSGRSTLAAWGISAALNSGLWSLPFFDAIIVILNRPTDHGHAGGNTVVLAHAPATWEPTFDVHEMGHAFGLQEHSFSANPDVEYGDPWDIMSAMSVYKFHGRFNETGPGSTLPRSGPGMNAPYLNRLGCMPTDRIWSPDGGMGVATVTLAALNHPEAEGYLMAKIPHGWANPPSTPTYTFELRQKDGWDRGIPRNTVLAHQVRTNGISYVQRSAAGFELLPGQTFTANGPEVEAQILSLDAQASRAVLKIKWLLHRWMHLSPIAGHGMEADFDCSGLDYAAKFAVVGDFNRDGRPEVAVAPQARGTAGNDFWVLGYDPRSTTWNHLSPIAGHGMEADLDCSGLDFAAKFVVVGDFDRDGSDEIAIGPDVAGTAGNDFWVMKYDPAARSWSHVSPIAGHGMEADFDCSGLDYAAKFACVGDFDGDRIPEIAVAPLARGTAGNDFWVMKYDLAARSWHHVSPIAGHDMEADFDCSGLDFAAKFAIVGDFDGDGQDEIATAPDVRGTSGNDFWVMKYDAAARSWHHLSPIAGHGMEADFDCSGLDYAAKFAVVGDFDLDGRDEIAIAADASGTAGNDFWVMKYDPATRSWHHLSPIGGHGMEADFDCSGLDFAARFALAADFDGDKAPEIAIGPDARGTAGNDFWVMKYRVGDFSTLVPG